MNSDVAIATNRMSDFQKSPRVQGPGADGGARGARKLAGAAARPEPERAAETQDAGSTDDRKAASRAQGGAQSFDGWVEQIEDADTGVQANSQSPGASLLPSVQQMPFVGAQFTGLLQRLGAESSDARDVGVLLSRRVASQSGALSSNSAELLRGDKADVAQDSLQAMIPQAIEPDDIISAPKNAAQRQQAAAASTTAQVSVEALRQETNFAAPVTVVVNEQRKFQPAQAVVSRIAMMQLLNGDKPASLQSSSAATATGPSVAERTIDVLPTENAEQSGLSAAEPRTMRAHAHHPASEPSGRQKNDAIEFMQGVAASAEAASPPGEGAAVLSAPSQQVRGAIADVISSAAPAPQTDYVALFDQHQATPSLMVRTLHLALNPQGLGHVEIKLNLAGNDLRLDIEASRADTARLIALDRDELNRELRNDGVELTSLSVTSREAATDTGTSSGTSGENQGNNSGQGAEAGMADMNARRDQDGARREAQPSFMPAQARTVAEAVDASPAAKSSALYI